jgi:ankyrin repeat protein
MNVLGTATALAVLVLAAYQDSTSFTPQLAPKTAGSLGESLHAAVRAGDLPEVKRLLAAGAAVDARDDLGSTPLLDAAWLGYTEIGDFLIRHGADINAKHGEAGSTPLQYAVLTGRPAMVRLLLEAGARTDGSYRDGQSVLHVAAAHGNAPIVELLLKAKADLGALDSNGLTPLDSAVLHGQALAVETLLRYHADVKYVHPMDGRGALHEACMRGFADLVQPLLAAGADLSARDRFGQTPLDIALDYKNASTVATLLRLGQKLKDSQHIAEEAMESATLRGQTEIARILLENGLEVNRAPANGSSYLNDAALKGQTKMVQLLLDHGASVMAQNQSGGTPLHDAALGGNPEVVALLLDHGAGIDERERESGATALMMAASMGRLEVVKVLLKRGANRWIKDKAGHTALERARDGENEDIVKLLEE